MPAKDVTIEFKTDLVQYSSFLMLYKWLGTIQLSDIKELIIEQGDVSSSINNNPEITTYQKKHDISVIMEALYDVDICLIREGSNLAETVYNGRYIKYTFVTDKKNYSFNVSNNRIDIDGKIYLVYGDYPIK